MIIKLIQRKYKTSNIYLNQKHVGQVYVFIRNTDSSYMFTCFKCNKMNGFTTATDKEESFNVHFIKHILNDH